MTFDYTALAELYPARSCKRSTGRVTYKRFEVAAEAVRFAMEESPPCRVTSLHSVVPIATIRTCLPAFKHGWVNSNPTTSESSRGPRRLHTHARRDERRRYRRTDGRSCWRPHSRRVGAGAGAIVAPVIGGH